MAQVIARKHGRRRQPQQATRGVQKFALFGVVLLVGVATVAYALMR